MPKLTSLHEGANRAEETAPWLASWEAHKGPAGQGRLWTASHGAVSAASRVAPLSLTRTVDSLPGRRRGSARLNARSPEKKGGGPSSYPGPRVPSAAPAHPESPPRGRAPKGSSGGQGVPSAGAALPVSREAFCQIARGEMHSALFHRANRGDLSTAERLTPGRRLGQKKGPARVGALPGRVVLDPQNLTFWPFAVNCAAQVRGARSVFVGRAPREGACPLR